jgi:RHS repeat-associated protein
MTAFFGAARRAAWLPLFALGIISPALAAPPPPAALAPALGQGVLAAPLVAWGTPASGETGSAARAIAAYRADGAGLETAALEQFAAAHPRSVYSVSLWLDIGLAHAHAGDYAGAISALNRSLAAAGPAGKLGYSAKEAVVDQTLAALLTLQTGLGHPEQLAALLADPRVTADGGVLVGPALNARRSLWEMRHDPAHSYLCGVVALGRMLAAEDPKILQRGPFNDVTSRPDGLTLADLQRVAGAAGEKVDVVRVAASAPIPVPSVMHWRLGHYVTIVAARPGGYLVSDPSLGDKTISRAVLEANGSGFFVVPAGEVAARKTGWRLASAEESEKIRGGGYTNGPDGSRTGCDCGDNGGDDAGDDGSDDGDDGVAAGNGGGGDGVGDSGDEDADDAMTTGDAEATGADGGDDGQSQQGQMMMDPSEDNTFTTGGGGSAGAAGGQAPSSTGGMPHYSFDLMTASVRIDDNPVGYHPPVGPDGEFQLSYNERDVSLPATPTFGNLGPQWSDGWLYYVQDDPRNPGSSVTLTTGGGGYMIYAGYNGGTGAFAPEEQDGAVLTRITTGTGTEYTRVFPDGAKEIFAASDGAASYPRHIFITELEDRLGNTQSFGYDSSNRLITVTDALGQVTTLQYSNTAFPLLVTSVTDPFGRVARIGYDSSGRLNSLTDAMGMTSTFTYNAAYTLPSTFIATMTTPYGSTSFNGSFSNATSYWATATDPLGNTERDEFEQNLAYPQFSEANTPNMGSTSLFNEYLNGRDTYYWDKATYAKITDKSTLATSNYNVSDYEKAVVYHWQHQGGYGGNGITSSVLESALYPLERNLQNTAYTSRVWYAHPGEDGSTGFTGSFDKPDQIARTLPDGSTELTDINYNAQDNIASTIDPMGRKTTYSYAKNGIDVTQVRKSGSGGGAGDLVASYTYNGRHEPLTVTDAAGSTTTLTYNGRGQVKTSTNALGQKTTYNYNGGYLTSIIDANGKTVVSYTYDNIGRIETETDSQGYTLAYGYDNLDRLTQISYPDGTTTRYKYNRLDIARVTDRLGRVTSFTYDANRSLTSVTDALGRTTKYGYDPDGRLIALTDAMGQKTTWVRDLEGRVTAKNYADGTSVTYAYDVASRLISRTDAMGQVTSYTYDKDGRLAGISYSNTKNPTPSVSFTWDNVYQRIDSMSDGTGTTTFSYVPAGTSGALQLAGEVGPAGALATYAFTYDALGRVSQLTVDGTVLDAASYDAIGRDVSHVTPLGQINTAYLGETAQISTVTNLGQTVSGGAGVATYSYLPNTGDRRLSGISFNAAPASNETLTSDDADRFLSRLDGTGKNETYTYDAADRLTAGSVTAPTPAYTETYGYNSADFITAKSGEPTAADNWAASNTGTVNQIGTLTPSGGAGRTYTYDANGNVLSDGVRSYTWDAENRLLSITEISTGHVSSFTYDGLSRRVSISETSGGTTTATGYLWCGDTICSAYSGGITTDFYQPEGELRHSNGVTTDYYYETDHLGTVTAMTGNTGATLGTLTTDAYGLPLSSSGTLPTFAYAGMLLHQPTSSLPPLYLTQGRAYDPYTGRWLSRDPGGEDEGADLYEYVNAQPVDLTDLAGLAPRYGLKGQPIAGTGRMYRPIIKTGIGPVHFGNRIIVNGRVQDVLGVRRRPGARLSIGTERIPRIGFIIAPGPFDVEEVDVPEPDDPELDIPSVDVPYEDVDPDDSGDVSPDDDDDDDDDSGC